MADTIRNVVLANVWSCRNKGDWGIVLGTVKAVARAWPQAELTLVSSFEGDDPRWVEDRAALRREPGVRLVGAPFSPLGLWVDVLRTAEPVWAKAAKVTSWGVRRGAPGIAAVGAARLMGPAARLVVPRVSRGAYRAFCEADVVLLKGGSYLGCRPGVIGLGEAVTQLYPALLAMALRKSCVWLGHSFWDEGGGTAKRLIAWAARRSTLITVREPLSGGNLAAMGAGDARAEVTADLAWLVEGVGRVEAARLAQRLGVVVGSRPVLGVSVRYCFPDDAGGRRLTEGYLAAVALAADWFISSCGGRVVFVPQVTGPPGEGEDVACSREVVRRMTLGEHAQVLAEELDPRQLVGLYGLMDLLIGTRFHSVLFALLAGTPALAVAYRSPKAEGTLAALDLPELVVDKEEIARAPEGLRDAARRIWAQRQCLRGRIQRSAAEARRRAWLNCELLRELALTHTPGEDR